MRYGNKKSWSGSNRCRGMYLVTMIALVVLLGVFSLLATRVFMIQVQLIQGSRAGITNSLKAEGLLGCLRKDVWNAQAIKVNETKTGIEITEHNENQETITITWQTNAEGITVREIKGQGAKEFPELHWKLPAAIHYQLVGAVLKVEITETREQTVKNAQYEDLIPKPRTTEIPLVSQIMLWRHDHE